MQLACGAHNAPGFRRSRLEPRRGVACLSGRGLWKRSRGGAFRGGGAVRQGREPRSPSRAAADLGAWSGSKVGLSGVALSEARSLLVVRFGEAWSYRSSGAALTSPETLCLVCSSGSRGPRPCRPGMVRGGPRVPQPERPAIARPRWFRRDQQNRSAGGRRFGEGARSLRLWGRRGRGVPVYSVGPILSLQVQCGDSPPLPVFWSPALSLMIPGLSVKTPYF